jgi:hypothetical protein
MFGGIGGAGSPAGGGSSDSLVGSWVGVFNAVLSDAGYVALRQITAPLDAVCDVALMAAGIGLLRLKNWARVLSIGYAIYGIILALIESAVMFVVVRRVLAGFPQVSQSGFGMAVGAAMVEAVITLAYPILLLYFLTRAKAVRAFQPGLD